MELWEELALRCLREWDMTKLIENLCYTTLERIVSVVRNGALDDADCFERIEEIVTEFEKAGISCGSRHDF